MKYLLFLSIALLFQDVPFKPKDEFDIKLNYEFRQRPASSSNKIVLDKSREDPNEGGILPYLTLKLNVLHAGAAVKARLSNNKDPLVSVRKIKDGSSFPIDIGFTDDVKDRVTAHEHIVTFLSEDRTEISKVVLFIDEDGTFLVNGEKRGRF